MLRKINGLTRVKERCGWVLHSACGHRVVHLIGLIRLRAIKYLDIKVISVFTLSLIHIYPKG